MLSILWERFKQKKRTHAYPKKAFPVPELFQGRPEINGDLCHKECASCASACPTEAISWDGERATIDLSRCIFCQECKNACPEQAISFTKDHRLCARNRNDLIVKNNELVRAAPLDKDLRKIFGRSLKLRQVSAGGCNACEADTNVLTTLAFDLYRFGIEFVASPRHADGLLVTGPVSQNMKLALQKTYAAIPSPKIVIAVGACSTSGGLFRNHAETLNGVDNLIPVDLYVAGCPPNPITILDGLLRLLGRID